MKIIAIADLDHYTLKMVKPGGIDTEKFTSEDALLIKVYALINGGFAMWSTSASRLILVKNERMALIK